MKLYINGDSHTAGAEAVNPHVFAEDDTHYFYMGRAPHPDNLSVSWGKRLSEMLKSNFICDAETASSNTRIMRTTMKWLSKQEHLTNLLLIIQWSTWEREEWLIDNDYYQVNASGIDIVPENYRQKYKEYIASVDWQQRTEQAHDTIWKFHQYLDSINVKHIFFNGNNHFESITERYDWGSTYIGPYDPYLTFDNILRSAKFDTVSPTSYHYGKEAHAWWAKYMLKYILEHKLAT